MRVVLIFSLIFIFLFLYLGQALWIYVDSSKRHDSYGWLWTILSLTSFPVPIIIYFIVSRNGMKKCNNCGKIMDKRLNICPYCGEDPNQKCTNCGYIIENNWSFCPNCNKKLK